MILGAALVLLANACASPPADALRDTAQALGLARRVLPGAGFAHLVLYRAPIQANHRLHIYLDGDGSPWLGRGMPAPDPTPRNPLVVRLMALDPQPALYLGRPCHGGLADPACEPWHWTHGRYSEAVVASLTAALRQLLAENPVDELVLIGFSGGGTLAMLVAPRLAEVKGVVTLAGNLDVTGWARRHGHSPLRGSLDPARLPPLPATIRQWHWVGAEDRVVPPDLVLQVVARQPNAQARVLPDLDHQCCWERLWPGLLRTLEL